MEWTQRGTVADKLFQLHTLLSLLYMGYGEQAIQTFLKRILSLSPNVSPET